LFKKILPSKKASENPVLRQKNFQDNHQHLELVHSMWTTAKTIIISVKGTPIFLKALDLFL